MDNLEKNRPTWTLDEFTKFVDKTLFPLDSGWEDYHRLMRSLRYGQTEMAKLLIQTGARVNREPVSYYDYDYNELELSDICTPLHLAISLGCCEIVKLLLNKGASIYIKNNQHATPLVMAAIMGKHEITDMLLTKALEENQGKFCLNVENISHLHIACMRNRADVVKQFLQYDLYKWYTNNAVKLESLYWPGYTPLHFAVQFQCIETVQLLVSAGANITAQAVNQLTPLHMAHMIRNGTIIDIILSVHKYETKNPVNSEGLSHFHIACTRNDPAVVERFLQQGEDVDMEVSSDSSLKWSGYIPIRFAVEYECIDVIKLLLLHDAHVSFEAMHCAYELSNKTIIDLLLSKKSIVKAHNDISISILPGFHVACMQKNVDVIEKLIQNGILSSNPVDVNSPTRTGCTPLHLAITQKCIKTTEMLLKHGADISVKDASGITPLHLAHRSKQNDIIDLILSKYSDGIDNPVDYNGLSHFHISCIRQQLETIKRFLENGLDINSSVHCDSVFYPGYTPLHFVADFQSTKVVKVLLEHGADFQALNGLGLIPMDLLTKHISSHTYFITEEAQDALTMIETILSVVRHNNPDSFKDQQALFHVFCINADIESMEQFLNLHPDLINRPVNWTTSDWAGWTPLHLAVQYNNEEAIDLLLEKEADISIQNSKGNTPLHIAFMFKENHERTTVNPKLFFTTDNPVGSSGYSHFHIACKEGNLEAVQHFLKLGVDVNKPTEFIGVDKCNLKSPLHLVLAGNGENSEHIVQLLLENGADVSPRDVFLNTPLHCGDFSFNQKAAKVLINEGADVNARNINNATPILSYGNVLDHENILFLLENGADINAENDEDNNFFMNFADRYNEMIRFARDDDHGRLVILMKHVAKLKLIGFSISENNEQYYAKMLPHCETEGYYEELDFIEECLKELEKMKKVRLDKYTILYDILNKNSNQMALHSENIALRNIINSVGFYTKFPIYGFLLKLQFKKGSERRPLLKSAKCSLKLSCLHALPETCSENIFQHLSNEDLQNIIILNSRGKNVK